MLSYLHGLGHGENGLLFGGPKADAMAIESVCYSNQTTTRLIEGGLESVTVREETLSYSEAVEFE